MNRIMKNITISIFISLLTVFTGCFTGHNNHNETKITLDFPKDIESVCYTSMDLSKSLIQSKGTSLKLKENCQVVKRNGTKKFGNMWCWWSPEWNSYVAGLCWGNLIEIGCNPKTGQDILSGVLTHEFAHYWLYTNFNDMSHNGKYNNVFYNWHESNDAKIINSTIAKREDVRKRILDASREMENGDFISLEGIDTNGIKYQIDFVVFNN